MTLSVETLSLLVDRNRRSAATGTGDHSVTQSEEGKRSPGVARSVFATPYLAQTMPQTWFEKGVIQVLQFEQPEDTSVRIRSEGPHSCAVSKKGAECS